MKAQLNQLTITVLHSFSQIMLQRSAVTGLLFCFGIGLNSMTMLLGGMLGILSSILTTRLYRYNNQTTQYGVYSFNAALVGIAISWLLPISLLSLLLIMLTGFLSTVIMHFILERKTELPAFTAPFVISTWLVLLIIEALAIETNADQLLPNGDGDLYTLMRGVAQVMFQGYWLTGVIFVGALLCSSYKVAIWAVIGSGLAMLTSRGLGFDEETVQLGGYSFNACLVAIAILERYKNKPCLIFIGLFLLGVLLSVILTKIFEQISLPALTAPFVLACWLIIGTIYVSRRIKRLSAKIRTFITKIKTPNKAV
jgi:urea transporter